MTVQVSKSATAIGKVALDAPIFDPHAFRLTDEQAAIIARARELGQSVFADRAGTYDRDAKFPIEDYERLLAASDAGDADAERAASRMLERRMRDEAKKIATMAETYYIPISPHDAERSIASPLLIDVR